MTMLQTLNDFEARLISIGDMAAHMNRASCAFLGPDATMSQNLYILQNSLNELVKDVSKLAEEYTRERMADANASQRAVNKFIMQDWMVCEKTR